MKINKLEAYVMMKESKGKIFTVAFVKKNGLARIMNCRLGVKKGLTGKGMSYKPFKKLLLSVYDMQKKEYRIINLNTMYSLVLDGIRYSVK